jgi:6-pyruvoyltetrahydropterin/6-carboxytetrahydropterin synthase
MCKKIYQVSKRLIGYSTCFRQWNASHSHCRYLHGYGLNFILYFESIILNINNWVWDFGWFNVDKYQIDGMTVKQWFDYMFDHTVIVAKDDPKLSGFQNMEIMNVIQLRTVEATGAEKFAEFIFHKLNRFVLTETQDRVRVAQVEFMEHGKNTAIFKQ